MSTQPEASGYAPVNRGQAMLVHLIEVHKLFRGQLDTLRIALSEEPAVAAGAAAQIAGRDLRRHCLYFCQGLTMHHTIEDVQWFPVLRGIHPDAPPVVDRLASEHEAIAVHLEELAELAPRLGDGDSASAEAARKRLAALTDELTAHLDYEEEALAPFLRIAAG